MSATREENRIGSLLALSWHDEIAKEVEDALRESHGKRRRAQPGSGEKAQTVRDLLAGLTTRLKSSPFAHPESPELWKHSLRAEYVAHLAESAYAPINLADSVGELTEELRGLRREVQIVRHMVENIQQQLDVIPDIQEAIMTLRNHVLDSEISEKSWLSLAEQAFAFWDNEEDAVYDAL